MLGNIRDITTVIVVGLLMFVGMLIFFIVSMQAQELTLERFNQGSEYFKSCSADYQLTNDLYQGYTDQDVIAMDVNHLAAMREQLDITEECNTDYVISNQDQISSYAEDVYHYLQTKYPEYQFGLLDTVYTAPAKYYAYLNTSQDYLFFAMSADESTMMAYVYKPLADDYQLTELWTIDQASDLEQVQTYTSNILVKYYEKVI